VQAHGPLAGLAGIRQRLGGVAGRGGLGEVVGEFGHVGPGDGAVPALDGLPDPPVQVHPGRDGQPLVEHLADQGVGEAVPADRPCLLGHHVQGGRLGQPGQDALGRQLAGRPDQ
jgi:hypothetical protein